MIVSGSRGERNKRIHDGSKKIRSIRNDEPHKPPESPPTAFAAAPLAIPLFVRLCGRTPQTRLPAVPPCEQPNTWNARTNQTQDLSHVGDWKLHQSIRTQIVLGRFPPCWPCGKFVKSWGGVLSHGDRVAPLIFTCDSPMIYFPRYEHMSPNYPSSIFRKIWLSPRSPQKESQPSFRKPLTVIRSTKAQKSPGRDRSRK